MGSCSTAAVVNRLRPSELVNNVVRCVYNIYDGMTLKTDKKWASFFSQ